MNLKRVSSRDLIALGVLLVVIAYIFLVFLPVKNETAELNTRKSELTNGIADSTNKISEKRKMDSALEEAFAEGDPIPIPDYSHINAVIAELNTILAPTLSYNVSFGQDQILTGVARRTISISFTAENYESAVEILSLIQSSDNQYLIDGVNLSGSTVDMTRACSANLSMICYEYIPETGTAA